MLQIYLTDLSAYNKGFLHGEWVSLPCNDLQETLKRVLKSGEALSFLELGYFEEHEEFFITDFEWQSIALFEVGEYEDIFTLNTNLELIKECSEYQLKAMKFLLDEGVARDIEDAFYRSDDVLIHEDTSMQDIAYELLQDCYGVDKLPSIIANNIDYYSIGEELEMDGNYTVVGGDVFEYIG